MREAASGRPRLLLHLPSPPLSSPPCPLSPLPSPLGYLALSGFLAGLLWGIKEPFLLVFLVCLATLKAKASLRAKYVVLASALFLAGMSVDGLLHAWESHDPWTHFRLAGQYSDSIVVRFHDLESPRSPGTILSDRGLYLQALLIDYGPAGILLLAGGLLLVFQWRRIECRLLTVAAVLFLGFLSLAPVRLRPLGFVETQVRYAVFFLPLLAIGAGAACAQVYAAAQDAILRRSLAAAFAVLVGVNLWIPGFRLDTHCRLACVGIRKCLQRSRDYGFSRLLFPSDYKSRLPDSYARYGVPLLSAGRDTYSHWEYDTLVSALDSQPELGVFAPARTVDVQYAGPRPEGAEDVRTILRRRGFQEIEIRVPGSTPGAWADRLGMSTHGTVAGWLHLQPQAGSKASAPPGPSWK